MGATINTKSKSMPNKYMKRAAELFTGAVGDYISESMYTTTSVAKDMRDTGAELASTLSSTTQSIMPKLRQLRTQVGFRQISEWFMGQADEYDENSDIGLNFDIDLGEDASLGAELTEFNRGANQISKSVVESSQKLAESQVISTANIVSSIDRNTAAITTGFKETTSLLDQILKVLTKNTAAIIETNAVVAANTSEDHNADIIGAGKFDMGKYRKMVAQNFKNSELGMVASMAGSFLENPDIIKDLLSPENLAKQGLAAVVNKAAPNLKKNLETLDDAINQTIMSSLLRIGEQRGGDLKGIVGRLFGLDGSRKQADTGKAALDVKATPYDTISREAVTSVIPEYLRQLVILNGGPDMVYDYRSRSFKTKAAIQKEFSGSTVGRGTLYGASRELQGAISKNNFNQMMFDLMMNNLGSNQANSAHRRQIEAIRDSVDEAKKYARELIGDEYGASAIKAAERYAEQLHKGLNRSDYAVTSLGNQVSTNMHRRNEAAKSYAETARLYEVDISDIDDSASMDDATIREMYGLKKVKGRGKKTKNPASASINAEGTSSSKNSSGLEYTNKALYEIYRRLEAGINVYQLKDPLKPLKPRLSPPEGYRSRAMEPKQETGADIVRDALMDNRDEDNLLTNNVNEDGTQENLSGSERFSRWGSKRGNQLMRALFNGSPDDIRKIFADSAADFAGLFKDEAEDQLEKANDSLGNITGMVRHKITGEGYTYQDGAETVHVKANKGILGFIGDEFKLSFENAKKSASSWFDAVKQDFNYGDDGEEKTIVDGRKRILAASLGAFAGAGILGGPIGLLVGGLGGAALSGSGVGKKLQNFLFGHDKETGEPTGALAKAADAVVSPIQFQLSKTMAVAGAQFHKRILGPLADIGLAIKDRATTRIDSIFKPITDKMKDVAGAAAKKIGTGIVSLASHLFGAKSSIGSTLVGKGARAVIGLVTGGIGIGEIMAGNKIGKRAFHKLSKGEQYPLFVGQMYYDPVNATEDDKHSRSHKYTLTANNDRVQDLADYPDRFGNPRKGVMLDGDNDKEWRPATKDYLRWRREQRNAKVDDGLRDRGYKGGVKGFFGGEYKEWRKKKWGRDQERRDRFAAATAEIRMTPEEIAEEQKKQSEREHEETQASLDQITGEIIPGHSFKTHDQGIHDRLDVIIQHLTGKPFGKTDGTDIAPGADLASNADEAFVNAAVPAMVGIASNGDGINKEEERLVKTGLAEAAKPNSDANAVLRTTEDLLSKRDEADEEKAEEEESFFEKLIGTILDNPALLGIAAAIPLLLNLLNGMDLDGLKTIMSAAGSAIQWGANTIGAIWNAIKEILGIGGDDEHDATESGMNIALAKADVAVQDKTDLGALGTLKHVVRDGAGNYIDNSTATTLKNDVTWAGQLRSGLSSMGFGTLTSDYYLNKAAALDTKAAEVQQSGGFLSNWRAKRLQNKSDAALEKADQALENGQATNVGTNLASNIARSYGRVAVIDLAGKGAGLITNLGSRALGANDETAEVVGNVTNAAVSGGLTSNLMYRTVQNGLHPNNMKQAWVDKILDGVITGIKFLAEKVGADKVVAKVATSKPVETIASICTKVSNALKTKIDDLVISKLEAGLTKLGVNNAAAVATAGLAVGAGAIAGGIDGWCKVNHLFEVLPGDEDATMKAISTAMGTALGAFSMTPAGFIVIILDTIDAILTAIPVIGKGLTQIVAQWIYSKCKGSAALAEKQDSMTAERDYYNETFGTNMNAATYNDMVNSSGVIDRVINGKATVDDDGHVNYDKGGAVLKEGGVANLVIGNRAEYVEDENGNVVRNSDNIAVKARDANGNVIKENEKIGDTISKGWNAAVHFVMGGKKYKTDENGRALVDEDGNYIEDEAEKNLIGKGADVAAAAGKAITDFGSDVIKGAGDFLDSINPFKKKDDDTVKTSSGADVTDADGKKITKGKVGKAASDIISGLTKNIGNLVGDIAGVTAETDEDSDVVDSDGKTVEDTTGSTKKKIKRAELGEFLTKGVSKLTSALTEPISLLSEGLDNWEKKEAPWKDESGDSKKSIVSWIGKKMTSFWDKIKGSVEGLEEGADTTTNGAVTGVSAGAKALLSRVRAATNVAVGGPVGPDDTLGMADTVSNTSGTTGSADIEGGNPLSKPFQVNSPYGPRSYPKGDFHKGIDIAPKKGLENEAAVAARFNGKVVSFQNNISKTAHKDASGNWYFNGTSAESAGNYVKFVTDDGLTVTNMHLKKGSIPAELQKVGATVRIGQKIGDMGSTGWSTGNHLHYQMERNGSTFDPSSSLNGGPAYSDVSSGSTTNADTAVTDPVSWVNSILGINGDSSSTDSDSTDSGEVTLSNVVEALGAIGSKALEMITGGLVSGDTTSGISTIIGGSGYEQFLNYSGNIKSVDDFLTLCQKEVGTHDDGNNKVKYNEWFYGKSVSGDDYPWCMAFVQYCFNKLGGLELGIKTAGCGTFLEYYQKNDPSKIVKTPKPGDVVIFSFLKEHDHTGIVKRVIDATQFETIEGNTSGTVNGDQRNGGVVANKTRKTSSVCAFIRAIDWDAFKIAINAQVSGGDGAEALWKYFKSLGYNDVAISGILGCFSKESGMVAKRIEGDYKSNFPGFQIADSVSALDNWARTGLKKTNTKSFYYYNGTAWPGLGYAQWTGERAYKLLEFAKQNGKKWYDPDLQLAYLQNDLKNNYYANVRPENLNKYTTPESATKEWCRLYEGYTGSGVADRQQVAKQLYSQYAGKFNDIAVGGPDADPDETIDAAEARRRAAEIDPAQRTRGKDVGVGGPIETGTGSIVSANVSRKPRKVQRTSTPSRTVFVQNGPLPKQKAAGGPSDDSTAGGIQKVISSSTNTDAVVSLLYKVIEQLEGINRNTGTSSDYLGQLSSTSTERATSSTSKTTTRRTTPNSTGVYRPTSGNNTRLVASMLRP